MDNARVSVRNNNHPNNKWNNNGFRVVLVSLHNFACRKYAQLSNWHRGKTGWPSARRTAWSVSAVHAEPNIQKPRPFQ
ncbi:MAG: hypothetical protein WA821_14730 [Anaerolineales bacterium]